MHVTHIRHTAGLAELAVPARSLRLVLTFCASVVFAVPSWSQTSAVFEGPHRLPHPSLIAPSAKPAADSPSTLHYRFITIGPESSPYAVADGINDFGLVTGYYEDTSSIFHGFVWQNGEFKTVDYPGAAYTLLYGVNNLGVAIGYYNDGTANHVVMYAVERGAWEALPDISGYPLNEGYGINDAGVAVGNAFSSTAAVAWVWNPLTHAYSYLAVPGAAEYSTSPSCLNDWNQIVGYYAI